MGERKNKKNRSLKNTMGKRKNTKNRSLKEEKETEKDVVVVDVSSSRLFEWTQILARLPAEDLVEFKLVCKSWCDLIQSSVFIDLHTTLNFSSSSSSSRGGGFGSFIFLAEYSSPSLVMLSSSTTADDDHDDDGQVRQVDDDNLGGGGGESDEDQEEEVFKVEVVDKNNDQHQQQQLVLKLKRLGFPSSSSCCCYESFKEIVGSCNGLVCLYDRISNRFCLCNPAIEESRILPQPINIGRDWQHRLAAFGFDVETKDYKVVLITSYGMMYYRTVSPMECICRVQVYSLSTDSWRLVQGITCLPGDPRYPSEVLCMNGSCFFLAKFFHTKQQPCFPQSDRFLISFDFAKEIITPIQLPDHHRYQDLYLSSLGGDRIALFIRKKQYPNGTCGGYESYIIWELKKEHGSSSSSNNNSVNKDSWTKLHSFRIEPAGEWNLPSGMSIDGEFALLGSRGSTGFGGNKMMLYDLVTKEVKRNFLPCKLVRSKAIAYKPSLVSILGGGKSSSSRG